MIKSKIKWAALIGLVLSLFSLLAHLLLARLSGVNVVQYSAMAGLSEEFSSIAGKRSIRREDLWGPVKQLEPLQPYANPRSRYTAAEEGENNGFIYAKIYGGFSSIRSSVCDLVAISRLVNSTLIVPEIDESGQAKRISSSRLDSFSYIYNKDQFIASLANDVTVVKSLPEKFKAMKKQNGIMTLKPRRNAGVVFYLEEVLPAIKRSSIVRLIITDGGCLQAILPQSMIEYQRLRCRVAFHALHFRPDIQVVGRQIIDRLRVWGQPYLAFHPGLRRETLAFHGCAELFQDLHTELIQHRRVQLIKRNSVRDKLSMESHLTKLNGTCPLMPEEVGVMLRAMGYPSKTVIYIAGSENFGGQRVLTPLRAMYPNLLDHSTLCSRQELLNLFGPESRPRPEKAVVRSVKRDWASSGPRPRPLPPPPARAVYRHEKEGWYGWITESNTEPDPDPTDRAHRLLLDALDYVVSVEADAFFPGFHNDGSPSPDFASLVMGHRLYAIASSRTFRPDRKHIAGLFNSTSDNLYDVPPDPDFTLRIKRHLNRSLGRPGLIRESLSSKLVNFLYHPLPECSCTMSPDDDTDIIEDEECPVWMRHVATNATD